MDLLYQTKELLSRLDTFTTYFGLVNLRPYQVEAANAVIQSVFDGAGDSFVWKFARQGGKDETLTALYEYLMTVLCHRDASIVVATPTFKPQAEISMQRLESRLSRHVVLQSQWRRQPKHIFRIRGARTLFFSAHRTANVVGATASHLLVVNEAQDVSPVIYDKHFAPMAAANNATRLFTGTAWTHNTLLAREERYCRLKQEQDDVNRVFIVDGHAIAKAHAPYGEFLQAEISRLGANNPIVLSQYLCQEIDAQAGMFTAARMALMQADASAHSSPIPGMVYAFLLDVAGQDEALLSSSELGNPGRDSTTLSIVAIDLSTLETLHSPTYRVVHRQAWTAIGHLQVFGQVKALADVWQPQHIVIDATGVGEGLWALFEKFFPTRVIPVKFTQQEKSAIGWRFLAVIETGRFRDCSSSSPLLAHRAASRSAVEGGLGFEPPLSKILPAPRASEGSSKSEGRTPLPRGSGETPTRNGASSGAGWVDPDTVRLQYANCHSEILPGPAKTLRWGVPDGTRGPDGELVHDDYLIADSLVAVLDRLSWFVPAGTLVIESPDPLQAMDHAY